MSYVLVSYDKDNGFGGIIKNLLSKKVLVSSEEQIGFKNLFDKYNGTSGLGQYAKHWQKHRMKLIKKTITSNINFTADTATAKSAMSSLTNALADYKENGLEKMDIFKLQVLNDEDTFGNTNMLAYSVGW